MRRDGGTAAGDAARGTSVPPSGPDPFFLFGSRRGARRSRGANSRAKRPARVAQHAARRATQGPRGRPGARGAASKGGQRKPIYRVVAGHDRAHLPGRRAPANATPAQGPEGPPRDTAARHPAHFAAGLRPWPRHEQEGFSSRPEPAPEGAAKEAHVWRLTHGQSPDNRQGPPGSAETQRPAGEPRQYGLSAVATVRDGARPSHRVAS